MAVLETGGIGYRIYVSQAVRHNLPSGDELVRIYTYLDVKEDDLNLYGFARKNERELFQMILSVSHIGPKTALTILSSIREKQFRQAVMQEEVSTLTSIKGIGKKTARRLILELKDKIPQLDLGSEDEGDTRTASLAVKALCSDSMGFSPGEAREAVSRIQDREKELNVQQLIQRALQELS